MDESSVDSLGQRRSLRSECFVYAGQRGSGSVDWMSAFNAPGGRLVNLDCFDELLGYRRGVGDSFSAKRQHHQLRGGVAISPPETFHTSSVSGLNNTRRSATTIYEVPRFRNSPTYIGTLPTQAAASLLARGGLNLHRPTRRGPPAWSRV